MSTCTDAPQPNLSSPSNAVDQTSCFDHWNFSIVPLHYCKYTFMGSKLIKLSYIRRWILLCCLVWLLNMICSQLAKREHLKISRKHLKQLFQCSAGVAHTQQRWRAYKSKRAGFIESAAETNCYSEGAFRKLQHRWSRCRFLPQLTPRVGQQTARVTHVWEQIMWLFC